GYTPAPETAVHTFCHAVPDRWYQMGVMLSATDSLNWLAGITGQAPSEMTRALGDLLQEPGKVRFLPYLSGERTPHNDAGIRGSFTGLSASTAREDLTRAVVEGVAFALRDSFDALKATGAEFERLFAIGGGSASDYWVQAIATLFGVPLQKPVSGEFGAALGAARLGMIAATGIPPELAIQPAETSAEIEPVADLQNAFQDAHQRFRRAYPAIRDSQ
ncbi:MAG: FGGY-family carbohydrate kinase, partial [Pseudomonadota bacterium]